MAQALTLSSRRIITVNQINQLGTEIHAAADVLCLIREQIFDESCEPRLEESEDCIRAYAEELRTFENMQDFRQLGSIAHALILEHEDLQDCREGLEPRHSVALDYISGHLRTIAAVLFDVRMVLPSINGTREVAA